MEASTNRRLAETIENYWNEHIHDQDMSSHPVGSAAFFRDLDQYRFDKLRYLPRLVDLAAYTGRQVLEVGCGLAIDLARFAESGALVTGIDIAARPLQLARRNFSLRGLPGQFCQMNGEQLGFPDGHFYMVYAHGVLQYTAIPQKMVAEIYRVLRPGGTAIIMVYNRNSWLTALSRVTKVDIEHQDAPALRLYSSAEFRQLLYPFRTIHIIPERFPVPTRLHHGLKAVVYNKLFVKTFSLLPRVIVKPFGWHLLAFATKQ